MAKARRDKRGRFLRGNHLRGTKRKRRRGRKRRSRRSRKSKRSRRSRRRRRKEVVIGRGKSGKSRCGLDNLIIEARRKLRKK